MFHVRGFDEEMEAQWKEQEVRMGVQETIEV